MLDLVRTPKGDLEIKNQVSKDLEYFAKEKNISIKEIVKEISKAQKISPRTLERIAEKDSGRPTNETLIKVYSFFYSTSFLTDLLIKVPTVIADSLKLNYYNAKSSLNKKISTQNTSEINELSTDSLFNVIYLMTSGDFGTDLATVREEFGKRGLQMLDKMIKLRIVKIDENERLTREDSIFLTKEVRKNMLVTLAKDIYKPTKNGVEGANYSGYFMGDVTPEDYELIYKDIRKCFDGIADRIFKSKPTSENHKRIVLGGILEEMESNRDGGFLC